MISYFFSFGAEVKVLTNHLPSKLLTHAKHASNDGPCCKFFQHLIFQISISISRKSRLCLADNFDILIVIG